MIHAVVTQVDHLRIARNRQIAADIDNLIALNNHDPVFHERI
jgi:hypothetical protein